MLRLDNHEVNFSVLYCLLLLFLEENFYRTFEFVSFDQMEKAVDIIFKMDSLYEERVRQVKKTIVFHR
ncbi:hypothetical protein J2T56_000936 [Natronobacillus azotifigens]